MFNININISFLNSILIHTLCLYIFFSGMKLLTLIKKEKRHKKFTIYKSIYAIFISTYWLIMTNTNCILCNKITGISRCLYFSGILLMLLHFGLSMTIRLNELIKK